MVLLSGLGRAQQVRDYLYERKMTLDWLKGWIDFAHVSETTVVSEWNSASLKLFAQLCTLVLIKLPIHNCC